MDFIRSNETITHYRFVNNGSGRTLLFINALGTDFRIWDEMVVGPNGCCNFLLYDMRGHGLSPFAIARKGLGDYMQDAVSLLDVLNIERFSVVGISLGGMIGQMLGYLYPDRIEKLVLLDTAARIGTMQSWNTRISQVQAEGIRSISGELMNRWFSKEFRQQHADKVTGYKTMVEQCPVEGYIQACESIRDADLTEGTKKISSPALCIAGSEDPSTTPEEVKFMAGMIKGSRVVIVPGSGHMPCIDNPDLVRKLILDFLK